VLSVLESQRFFPASAVVATKPAGEPLAFFFTDCESALAAYRERLPKAIELAKAIAVARLETEGEYDEQKHDPIFADFGARGLDGGELSGFPDYFVSVNAANLAETENARLMEILSAGLPIKVLVQSDDLREDSPVGNGQFTIGSRSRQLAGIALGQNDIYVLQSSASNLVQYHGRIQSALTYSGPALFSVFTGAAAKAGDLPPYLIAAAAMESRAFPAFAFDPSAGPDWASRFCIAANPQADLDWPVASFGYEDEQHQRVSENLAFTLVDFLACDRRFDPHFARVPRPKWNGTMISVSECVASQTKGLPEKIPHVLMVDGNNVLQKIIVDGQLIREARRCIESWHSLQELGGIHNSHAKALLAREKQGWEEQAQREAESRAQMAKPAAEAQTAAPVPAAPTEAAPAPAEPERDPDQPYIETARCSTCNECTLLNNKMFAYNENQQAYIKDPDAGTFRQLVEAAESCQVSVIHPGKPRNPNEPGLEELIKRAEPFQ
jgi:hypothetical protein